MVKHVKLFEDYSTEEDYEEWLLSTKPDRRNTQSIGHISHENGLDDEIDDIANLVITDIFQGNSHAETIWALEDSDTLNKQLTDFIMETRRNYHLLEIDSEDIEEGEEPEFEDVEMSRDEVRELIDNMNDFFRDHLFAPDKPFSEKDVARHVYSSIWSDDYGGEYYNFLNYVNEVPYNGIVEVFRMVRVGRRWLKQFEKADSLMFQKMGSSWTYEYIDDDSAWYSGDDPVQVQFGAKVHISSIDWYETVVRNLNIDVEKEIVLFPNSNIQITFVEIDSENEDISHFTTYKAIT